MNQPKDDTEHLLSSPANAERLEQSIAQLEGEDRMVRVSLEPSAELNQFAGMLVAWHEATKARVHHATQIPADGSITLEYDGKEHKMEGDKHLGFVMGLAYAYAEFGTLPFHVEMTEDPAAASELADESKLS